MHPHNPGSYLGDLDAAFTWISKRVLMDGVLSVVSYQPAEICHHLERRLTNPTAILNPFKLAPITGREHDSVHSGKLLLSSTAERRINVVDTHGARFISDTTEFCKLWQHYLNLWWANKLP